MKEVIHMSFKKYEANGCGPKLGLLIILQLLCVSYPTRSVCREKSIQNNTRLL